MQQVIEWVRSNRNNRIKSFGEKNTVVQFFLENYGIKLSDRKYEFLARELTELLIAPVDLAHYASAINEYKQAPDSPQPFQQCDELVMQELLSIFKKYAF